MLRRTITYSNQVVFDTASNSYLHPPSVTDLTPNTGILVTGLFHFLTSVMVGFINFNRRHNIGRRLWTWSLLDLVWKWIRVGFQLDRGLNIQ
jgi:hypothetical protein